MTEATAYKERNFLPVDMFLGSARVVIRRTSVADSPLWSDLMAAASLLSLSLEALVNSTGPHLVSDFGDFDSASPIAKLRIIYEKIGLSFDKSCKPIADILELARFRNKMAHPKFKKLTYVSEKLPLEKAQKLLHDESLTLHDLERAISPEAVKRWLDALTQVANALINYLEPDLRYALSRSWLEICEE